MKTTWKKVWILGLILVLCLSVFAGCGKDTPTPQTPEEVTGETYDAGNVSALVPTGWKAFPVSDMFDEYEGDNDPNAVQICKGGESDLDLFTKPYLHIIYSAPDEDFWEPTKDFYENTADVQSMELGGYTWQGFTATSLDEPIAVLWTQKDGYHIQVNVTLGSEDDTITLQDADVQAILASIKPTE